MFVTTDGLTLSEINGLFAGENGTPVILRLERPGGSVKDVGLVRGPPLTPDTNAPSLAGLGLNIELGEYGCSVLRVVPGGSAHRHGQINVGDLLLAVRDAARSPDFVSIAGMDMDRIRSLILGPAGSLVSLRLERPNPWPLGATVYVCDGLIRGIVVAPSADHSQPPQQLPSTAAGRYPPAGPPSVDVSASTVTASAVMCKARIDDLALSPADVNEQHLSYQSFDCRQVGKESGWLWTSVLKQTAR